MRCTRGGPVERRDGDVDHRRRAGGQAGIVAGDIVLTVNGTPRTACAGSHASRLRQHRPQGGAARDPGGTVLRCRPSSKRVPPHERVVARLLAARRLRISIRTEDPALLAELRRIIVEAGHDVRRRAGEADVLMHDARGEARPASRR